MKLSKTISAVVLAGFFSTSATAATVNITEGFRDQVAGTITASDASPTVSGAYKLGILTSGQSSALHGRIVGSSDHFVFSAEENVSIDFIFGGYDLVNGGSKGVSGFTAERNRGNTSVFALYTESIVGSGVYDLLVDSATYTTGVTGAAHNHDSTRVLSAVEGLNYMLSIEGSGAPAYYDLKISAVPLPASALMLLAGLGGIAAASRRKKA